MLGGPSIIGMHVGEKHKSYRSHTCEKEAGRKINEPAMAAELYVLQVILMRTPL